ncbi:unnamed protein product [Caenorhabditis auriculariae]|uniref:Uncharacterized protein n=1 Tax=Caenorhabditis auriculariae TaxID=2777116 RepID=A0A8S1H0C9_9PELO|nr:unnamed protein product [Caenorhabditis auriculariae]
MRRHPQGAQGHQHVGATHSIDRGGSPEAFSISSVRFLAMFLLLAVFVSLLVLYGSVGRTFLLLKSRATPFLGRPSFDMCSSVWLLPALRSNLDKPWFHAL